MMENPALMMKVQEFGFRTELISGRMTMKSMPKIICCSRVMTQNQNKNWDYFSSPVLAFTNDQLNVVTVKMLSWHISSFFKYNCSLPALKSHRQLSHLTFWIIFMLIQSNTKPKNKRR